MKPAAAATAASSGSSPALTGADVEEQNARGRGTRVMGRGLL